MSDLHSVFSEDAGVAEATDYFKGDRFAVGTLGIKILEASRGHSKCEMAVTDSCRNQMDNVMGGVYFTLADFAFAVACNTAQSPTVSVNLSMDHMRPAKGDTLTAVGTVDKFGRTLVFARVEVFDGEGNLCSRMQATGARVLK